MKRHCPSSGNASGRDGRDDAAADRNAPREVTIFSALEFGPGGSLATA